MTDMKRITISLPDDLDEAVEALRKTERFANRSYSEIIRHLVGLGLEAWGRDNAAAS